MTSGSRAPYSELTRSRISRRFFFPINEIQCLKPRKAACLSHLEFGGEHGIVNLFAQPDSSVFWSEEIDGSLHIRITGRNQKGQLLLGVGGHGRLERDLMLRGKLSRGLLKRSFVDSMQSIYLLASARNCRGSFWRIPQLVQGIERLDFAIIGIIDNVKSIPIRALQIL